MRKKLAAALAVGCLTFNMMAAAQSLTADRRQVEIPAQGLDSALQALATAQGLQISYAADGVNQHQTRGVSGELTTQEALTALLAGTGLTFRALGNNAVSIIAADQAAATPAGQQAASTGQVASSAQTAAGTDSTNEVKSLNTVSVAASRIDQAGFVAPTPTVIVGETELRQGARNNVAAALNDLPAFIPASTPLTSPGNTGNGQTNLNFRGLGSSRTLVMLDRHRFVGDGDLNSVPFALVKNVDVVTGGASAAWGSDAVAGVVNITLDDRLEGTRLEARTGLSARDDGLEYTLSAATGASFAEGRGNFIVGAEFVDNEGIFPRTAREYTGRWGIVNNPDYTPTNGQAEYVLSQDVVVSNASLGGLIVDGSLAGQTFNPDGSLRPFRYGRVSGTTMVGGEGVDYDDFYALSVPQKRYNVFSRVGFDLTDNTRLTADVRYSRMYNNYKWHPEMQRGQNAIKISVDNAFLSPSVRDRLLAANETEFSMGRINHDFARLQMEYVRENMQGTVALEGLFGDYWRWDAYLSYGRSNSPWKMSNSVLAREWFESVDSVRHPVTGEPVCRVALTNPSSTCVPINLFGEGNVSEAARNYVLRPVYRESRNDLLTGGASLRGEPFELPAGPVSIATGIEARREETRSSMDPRTTAEDFLLWNPQGMQGSYNVKEGFLEAVVPVVKDVPLLHELSFNGAARLSHYSTSGSIWTYKLGITNQITPSWLLRATKSRDIRSANLGELYSPGGISFTSVVDPLTGAGADIRVDGGGNPDLVPEVSDTRTVGLVFTPQSIPDLSISLDYFDITIDDIITSIGSQEMVNRCYSGNAALCDFITRDPDTNVITRIRSPYLNLASYQTNGVDLDFVYNFPLEKLVASLPGKLRLRGMLTYVDELVTDDGVNRIDDVGASWMPRIRANLGATYENNGFSADLRARYIHSVDYDPTIDLQNNAIPSYTYFDLGTQYTLSSADDSKFSIFANVSNLFDKNPPQGAPTDYDLIGRYYSFGARLEF